VGFRQKIESRVTPFLPPGETYAAAVPAMGGITPKLAHRYRVVVVTNAHVHLYSANLWRWGKPRRLLATSPPGTLLEPRRTSIYEEITVAGEVLWVTLANRALLPDVVAAARRLGGARGLGTAESTGS
jgi:hypothetical protein